MTPGNQIVRRVAEHEVLLIPGDPGVTFTKGDRVCMSNGVAILATDSLADSIGIVEKTIVCPAATQAFPVPPNPPSDLDGAEAKTLIPVMMDLPAGKKVFVGNMKNYVDETVVTYASATRKVGVTTGFGANDRPNGALAYVYEGPGKGELNIVEDYVHTGGTVELELLFHRAFTTTLTSSSKMVVLGSTAAANGVGLLGRMDVYDEDEMDVIDGADDGNYIFYCDFLQAVEYIKNLTVPYINSSASWLVTPNS